MQCIVVIEKRDTVFRKKVSIYRMQGVSIILLFLVIVVWIFEFFDFFEFF